MKALIPLDGSPTSAGIVSTVRKLLDLQPLLELHLATVLDPKSVKGRQDHLPNEGVPAGIGRLTVAAPLPRVVESHGEAMDRTAGEAKNTLKDFALKEFPGRAAEFHALWSSEPAEAINALAEEIDADVIVMATHGRSGFSHLVAGSVTEGVIRHSTRPVLVQGPGAA